MTVPQTSVTWRKSTRSSTSGGACVELGSDGQQIVSLRDSKNPDGPVITITRTRLVSAVKAGYLTR